MKKFPDGHKKCHNTECVYTIVSLCWVLFSPTGSAGFIYISLTSVFTDSSDQLCTTGRPTSYLSLLLNGLWACVHSVGQKSIGLKFSKSRTGSHVTYSCHHKSSRFTFPGARLAVLLEKDEAIGPSPF